LLGLMICLFNMERIRASSSSRVHRRDANHRFGSYYNYLSRSRIRRYGSGRDAGLI